MREGFGKPGNFERVVNIPGQWPGSPGFNSSHFNLIYRISTINDITSET